MTSPLSETIVIEFSDTDLGGNAHYSKIIRYFDVGLRLILTEANVCPSDLARENLGIPISDLSCSFHKPMFYGDEVRVKTSVSQLDTSWFELQFQFDKNGTIAAQGNAMYNCIDLKQHQKAEIPRELQDVLMNHTDT